MIFNSIEFAIFIAIFYNFYLHLKTHRAGQNAWLLLGSYVFYGWWDWRFLSLLVISTVIDFNVGRAMRRAGEDQKRRKQLLLVSVITNLSILGFFKYFNFFADSLVSVANSVGLELSPLTLNIVLPVGISFYTFQTLSYSIDVYRRKLEPTDSLLDFAVFVSFFPQLVAGPIERAQTFLPQVAQPRTITSGQVEDGIFLVVWGLFKKVVIADNAALIANEIFNNYTQYAGLDLILGALAFTVQIYGDFSGYSDIARGLAKLMGFELMVNFKLPYFSLTPSEFWQRWHVSLSSWLRDYLYIALGGNRGGTWKTYRNLSLTMLLGGLWHGAAWNFIIWGAFHGAILVIYRIAERPKAQDVPFSLRAAKAVPAWVLFFGLTVIGWIIFRAESARQIGYFLQNMWSLEGSANTASVGWELLFLWAPLIVVQIFQYVRHDLLAPNKLWLPARGVFMGLLIAAMFLFGSQEDIEFIYFQF